MASSSSTGDFYLQGVAQEVAAGNLPRAFQLATNALQGGLRHPVFFNARALWFEDQLRFPEAVREFEQALALAPQDAVLLNALGMAYVRSNRANEGVAAFDRALALAPNSALIHFRRGWACASTGDQEAARQSYERAIELQPNHAEALAALASIAARDSKPELARDYATRALTVDPGEPTAIVALAMVENAASKFAEAEALLRRGLQDPRAVGHTKAVLLGFLGDALAGQERSDDAFTAYRDKNEEFRRLHAPRLAAGPRATEMISQLAAQIETMPESSWRHGAAPAPVANGPRVHAFLLGFLRSGTTLLEQVLNTSTEVVNLEERDSLAELSGQFMRVPDGLENLAALEGAALDAARAAYWKRVRGYGVEPAGRVFLDKQPLNTFNLPLISKLFPEAKIIFALRDPRDVLFSCYRRHFEVNSTMFEFLSLAGGARFYDAVMRVGELCRASMPLTLHEHRYEDMIEDFDSRVRAVCDFLNLEWSQDMRSFSTAAQERAIRSPSAAQVRRPLYSEGVGQWRRYAAQLEPALPILAPWVKRFGYSET